MGERIRKGLACTGDIEDQGAEQRREGRRVAQARQGPAPDERRAAVGRGCRHRIEECQRPRGIALGKTSLRAPDDDIWRRVVRHSLEPQLGSSRVTFCKVEVGQLDERILARIAPRLGDGERPSEGLADLGGGALRAPPRPPEPNPDLCSRRSAQRELLESEGKLRVEMSRVAGIGEQRQS